MEQKTTENRDNQKKKNVTTTVPIRVRKETARELKKNLLQLNKKDFGRRVKADDMIALALSLLNESHFKKLTQSTLSYADKFEQAYRDFCEKNGHITKDQFLGKVMRGEAQGVTETSTFESAKSA